MENPTTKNRPLDMAFVVDAEQLKQLNAILSEIGHGVEYSVKFSDGSTVQYELGEVLNQPNSTRRAITAISANVEGRGVSANVTLRENPVPPVEYMLSGPQNRVIYFADKLDDWTATTARWYSIFFSSASLQLLPLISALAFPFVVASGLRHCFPTITWLPAAGLLAMIAGESCGFKLFPRGTFAIGDGLKRSKRLASFAGTYAAAFVLSFIGGILANLITRKI